MGRRRKNTFSKALGHLKSTTIDEKLQMLSERPTNSVMTYMTTVANTVNPDFVSSERGQENALGVIQPDFSVGEDPTTSEEAKDTSGLFKEDGTIRVAQPPITEASPDRSYILGPMAAMYYTWSYPWTMIGYIRQSDRKFVNLARIDGKLSDWDGSSNFNNSWWGSQLTLEQAVWFRDVQKNPGATNDPATYNYRAFYPGPPSNTPDAFGRYYCITTGEPIDPKLPGVGEPPNKPGEGGEPTPGDIFSAIMDRKRRGEKLSKAEEDWLKENLPPLNSMKGNLMNTHAYTMPEDEFEKKYGFPPDRVRDYYGYGDWAGDSPPDANKGFSDRNELLDYADTLKNALDKQAGGRPLTPKELYALESSGVAGADHTLLKGMLSAVKAGKIVNLINGISKWWNKGKNFGKGGEEQWDWKKLLDDDWSKRQQSKLGKGDWDILRLAKFWKEGSLGSGPTPAAREFFRRFGPIGNELYNKIWGQKLPPADDVRALPMPGPGDGERDSDNRYSIQPYKGPGKSVGSLPGSKQPSSDSKKALDNVKLAGITKTEAGVMIDILKGGKGNVKGARDTLKKNMSPAGFEKLMLQLNLAKGPEGDRMYAGGSKDFDERTGKYRSGKKSVARLTASYHLQASTLSESRKTEILKNLKKPVVLPETKQKSYKVKPKLRGIISKPHIAKASAPAEYKPPENLWGKEEYNHNVKRSQEKMNAVYELLGDGSMALEHMLTDSNKMNAAQLDKFWGLHPELYSYFYNGKKYKAIRKEQLKGDYLVFLIDENGVKSNILQSELNEKLAEEQEMKELEEYNKMNPKNEPISFEKDYMFKKAYQRLKKEVDYPKKPAKKGYPDEPPPKMVNGYHPEFGKRYKYDKLDPHSAEAMPNQDNPEIDANIEKAKKQPKIQPGKKPKVIPIETKTEQLQLSNWRKDLEK